MRSKISLSEDWCVYPRNNRVVDGQRVTIATCNTLLDTYMWLYDGTGRIKSYEDQNFCLQQDGIKMKIYECSSHLKQRWVFAHNGRILRLASLLKGAIISDDIAAHNQQVSVVEFLEDVTVSESFVVNYESGGDLALPNYTFRIVSDVKTQGVDWCIFPKGNDLKVLVKVAVSECKTWQSFKWWMDDEGKLRSFKDSTKCIGLINNTPIINIQECVDGTMNQRWIYSILDRRLLALKNGKLAGIIGGVAAENTHVINEAEAAPVPIPHPSHQLWTLEES